MDSNVFDATLPNNGDYSKNCFSLEKQKIVGRKNSGERGVGVEECFSAGNNKHQQQQQQKQQQQQQQQ